MTILGQAMRNLILDAATVVVALTAVVVGAVVISNRDRVPLLDGEDQHITEWRLYAQGHWMGPRDARAVIVEWGDYQCPACRRFHMTLLAVLEKYPDDVALVYRHWPLASHQFAYPAARAAECAAQQGAFAEFHKRLMETESWLGDAFARFAADAGVHDLEGFASCLADEDPVPSIEEDIEAVHELGGRGTPTLLINGILLGGTPRTAAELEKRVLTAMGSAEG